MTLHRIARGSNISRLRIDSWRCRRGGAEHEFDHSLSLPPSPADVDRFEDEMRATKVDWQFVSYGGAVHGFSNPKNNDPEHGLVYDKKADQRSWKAMQDFFNETFAK
ncbi:MAG TPA: dienelactone hydrolase family protein [Xanthobacteraceae bacterium]|nr:dienelactone hydrolase family protein [Xanthobacteraceae bacterium]